MCLYQYSGYTDKTYFSEMNGFVSEQPVLLAYIGIIELIFAGILIFCRSVHGVLTALVMLCIVLLIPLNMFYSASFWQIILDSIYFCQNKWLIAAVLGQAYFLIFSSLFIVVRSRD